MTTPVQELYRQFDPREPLAEGDPRYVDTLEARGIPSFLGQVWLPLTTSKPVKILVRSGPGTGITTMMLHLRKRLQEAGRHVKYLDTIPRIDFTTDFNLAFGEIDKKLPELPIAIVDHPDDLNKRDIESLFSSPPEGHLIIVVPWDFKNYGSLQLLRDGGADLAFPQLEVFNKDSKINGEVAKTLREIVRKRAPVRAFSDDALDILCEHSEGNLRKLMTLIQMACTEAFSRESLPLVVSDVEAAIHRFDSIHGKITKIEHSHDSTCGRFYLRRIELDNVRGFHSLNLPFETSKASPRMQTVVIGRNGTCKTTLLRAIALAFADEQDASALLSAPNGRWVTEGAKESTIRLDLEPVGGGKSVVRAVKLIANGQSERVELEGDPSEKQLFICAYGMGRGHFGGEPGRGYRTQDSVATLFRYEERLAQSELVLRRLNDFLGSRRFDAVLNALKRALGLGPEHRIELPPGGGVEISGPDLGARVPLEGWADGYRMTFSWMIDFYGRAMRAGAIDEDGDIRGVLLIDELEQHLHPDMQRELLAHLAKALPHVQIIATTHSPVIALTVSAEQIVSLQRDGAQIRTATVPNLDAYSAEDVLVEKALFGTDPYSPETRRRLDRHLELARIPPEERTEEQVAELQEIVATMDPASLPVPEDDPVVARLDEIKAALEDADG